MNENTRASDHVFDTPQLETESNGVANFGANRSHHRKKRHRHLSSDDSDIDSLTEDLDQIGKLSLNINLSSFNLPNMSSFANISSLPKMPNLPRFELSRIQEYSKELSNYFSSYVNSTANAQESKPESDQDYQQVVNSIKTAISTRIQMNNFLQDLKVGVNINSAIDRLQPLTDLIHETILLPVDDMSDDEVNISEEETEPVAVEKIVNSDRPLIPEIVKPEASASTRDANKGFRRWKHRQHFESDENQTGSDLDHIEGLSEETIKQLSDLSSVDDFAKEEILRKKIQEIRQSASLNQMQKNKLVTRLMMGNYFKYIKEVLPNNHLSSKLKSQRLTLQDLSDYTIEEELLQNEEEVEPEEVIPPEQQLNEGELDEKEMDKDMDIDEDNEGDEVFLIESDLVPSYHDPPFNTTLGCQHYMRNCKIECPTCLKWFPCRFCHDHVVTDHKLVRNEVKHILCMKCNTPQEPDTSYCINCEAELANYFCNKCVLYDNDATKDIYHCDKCGICRLGLGLGKDYFHCDKCNICLSIDLREKHKCVTNSTHSNCPICNEYLFTSVHKVVFMKCGHTIHQSCYDELVKHSYKCPICKKTVVNVETQFRILDQEILHQPLPSPYNLWRCIVSCNDCKGKSNVNYHILGLKCKYCKSYNTNQLKLIKPEEEEEEELQEEQEIEHNFDENVIRSVQQNILTNFRIGDGIITSNLNGDEDEEDYEEEYDEDFEEDQNDDNEAESYQNDANGDDGLHNVFDLANLNRKLHSKDSNINVGYISSIFQNFINNAGKKDKTTRSRSMSNVSGISRDDMIGGF